MWKLRSPLACIVRRAFSSSDVAMLDPCPGERRRPEGRGRRGEAASTKKGDAATARWRGSSPASMAPQPCQHGATAGERRGGRGALTRAQGRLGSRACSVARAEKSNHVSLPKRDELPFRIVFALPNASSTGDALS
eukprot:1814031-Prymnesium_polylepis.1